MASPNLSERVAKLEAEVANLRQELAEGGRKKDWRRAVDKYKGDEDVLIIFREAAKLREADRKATRDINGGLRRKRGKK